MLWQRIFLLRSSHVEEDGVWVSVREVDLHLQEAILPIFEYAWKWTVGTRVKIQCLQHRLRIRYARCLPPIKLETLRKAQVSRGGLS